jgi:hypothetical protein
VLKVTEEGPFPQFTTDEAKGIAEAVSIAYAPPVDEFNVREDDSDDFSVYHNEPTLDQVVDRQLDTFE